MAYAPVSSALALFDFVVSLLFFIDIILTLRVKESTFDLTSGTVHSRLMCKSYATTWMLPDIFAAIPLEFNAALFAGTLWLRLLTLLRLVRLRRMSVVWRILKQRVGFLDSARLIKLLFAFIFMIHWAACAFFLLPQLLDTAYVEEGIIYVTAPDWLETAGLNGKHSYSDGFVMATYWSVVTVTSVGYGDIAPTTRGEMVFGTMIVGASAIYYSLLLASVTNLVARLSSKERHFSERLELLDAYCTDLRLPRTLQSKLADFFTFVHGQHANEHETNQLLAGLPPLLQSEVAAAKHKGMIRGCPLLSVASDPFISLLAMKLTQHIGLAGQTIFQAGEPATGLYFVKHGEVLLMPQGFNVDMLKSHKASGDLSAALASSRSLASASGKPPLTARRKPGAAPAAPGRPRLARAKSTVGTGNLLATADRRKRFQMSHAYGAGTAGLPAGLRHRRGPAEKHDTMARLRSSAARCCARMSWTAVRGTCSRCTTRVKAWWTHWKMRRATAQQSAIVEKPTIPQRRPAHRRHGGLDMGIIGALTQSGASEEDLPGSASGSGQLKKSGDGPGSVLTEKHDSGHSSTGEPGSRAHDEQGIRRSSTAFSSARSPALPVLAIPSSTPKPSASMRGRASMSMQRRPPGMQMDATALAVLRQAAAAGGLESSASGIRDPPAASGRSRRITRMSMAASVASTAARWRKRAGGGMDTPGGGLFETPQARALRMRRQQVRELDSLAMKFEDAASGAAAGSVAGTGDDIDWGAAYDLMIGIRPIASYFGDESLFTDAQGYETYESSALEDALAMDRADLVNSRDMDEGEALLAVSQDTANGALLPASWRVHDYVAVCPVHTLYFLLSVEDLRSIAALFPVETGLLRMGASIHRAARAEETFVDDVTLFNKPSAVLDTLHPDVPLAAKADIVQGWYIDPSLLLPGMSATDASPRADMIDDSGAPAGHAEPAMVRSSVASKPGFGWASALKAVQSGSPDAGHTKNIVTPGSSTPAVARTLIRSGPRESSYRIVVMPERQAGEPPRRPIGMPKPVRQPPSAPPGGPTRTERTGNSPVLALHSSTNPLARVAQAAAAAAASAASSSPLELPAATSVSTPGAALQTPPRGQSQSPGLPATTPSSDPPHARQTAARTTPGGRAAAMLLSGLTTIPSVGDFSATAQSSASSTGSVRRGPPGRRVKPDQQRLLAVDSGDSHSSLASSGSSGSSLQLF